MNTVKLINITDYPGRTKTILEIYGVSILPGDSIPIATDLLDDKIFAHEYVGQLAINTPPEYYENFKRPAQLSKKELLKKMNEEALLKVMTTIHEVPMVQQISQIADEILQSEIDKKKRK